MGSSIDSRLHRVQKPRVDFRDYRNRNRKQKVHTILFFIAIVANCGGLLTPLGDPPLFMMYLRGAPFEWFFHLIPALQILQFHCSSHASNKVLLFIIL